jgi:hypothetical protein
MNTRRKALVRAARTVAKWNVRLGRQPNEKLKPVLNALRALARQKAETADGRRR